MDKSVKHYENTCPYCGSKDIIRDDTVVDATVALFCTLVFECCDCDKRWSDEYKLVYVETIIDEED